MNMKMTPLIIIFLSFSCFIFPYGKGQSIRIGTVENLPPFSFYNDHGLTGIDIDIITEVAKRLDLTVSIETLPWARVIYELKDGTLDAAFSLYYAEDRIPYIMYLSVMHYDNLGIMTRTDNGFNYSKTEDLYNKIIGKGTGVYISDDFEQAVLDGKIIIEEINDTEMGNIKKLYAKRVDAIIGVVETMRYYARNLGHYADLYVLSNYIESNRPGYFVVSKQSKYSKDQSLLESIKKEIDVIMNDGTYQQIKERYAYFY